MRKTLAAIACALVFSASPAQGAEYFIYQDPAGKVVLSNITPPSGAEVIKRHNLQEVSDEAVRAALEQEHSFWLRLEAEQLAESNRMLAESNDRLGQAVIAGMTRRESEPAVIVQTAEPRRFGLHRLHAGRVRPGGKSHAHFRQHLKSR